MSRFKTNTLCRLLLGITLALAGIIQGISPSVPVYAAQTATKPGSPDIVYQSDTSPYDGIYSGTFYYEYREWIGNENRGYTLGDWIEGSFDLTVTFEAIGGPLENYWGEYITHVKVTDPAFNTGVDGVDINFRNFYTGDLEMPASAVLPGDTTSPFTSYQVPYSININFPDGAKLSTAFPNMPIDDLKVDSKNETLSGSKWQAVGTPEGHPLSGELILGKTELKYQVIFKSWSLKKLPQPPDISIYDGTYSGIFNYKYRENIPVNNEDPNKGEYRSGSLRLTVTFKTKAAENGHPVYANITRVIVSDPDFDTTDDGLIPNLGSKATLPPDPTKPDPVLNMDPSQLTTVIFIYFPNEGYIKSGVKGVARPGDISVSPDGLTLSGDTWSGRTPRGIFIEEQSNYFWVYVNQVEFGSWSLHKVSGGTGSDKTDGAISNDVAGDLQIRKSGEGDWIKYDQTGLNSGDEIKTGNSSNAVIETPDSDKIAVKPNSELTIREWTAGENYSVELLSGELHAQVEKSNRTFEVRTPAVVTSVRGTEFTVNVENDGTTTVMAFEGAVSVTDITSNNGITLVANQSITVPNTPTGLTQEQMLGRVTRVPTETLDKWWEKNPAPTGEQSTARQEGSLVVGKFVIMSTGTQWTPAGFVFGFTLIAAIFFLVVGQVFSYRLRRLSKRK